MAITVSMELGYEFEVRAGADEVFTLLADVPTSASFYPKVDKLVDLGDNAYRWEMARIGFDQFSLQTVYASRYSADAASGRVEWVPVEGVGNGRVWGHWSISGKKKSTLVVLNVQAELSLPLPALLKIVAAPLVESEFEKMTEQYIDNLIQRFGGEV
ncbi:MAG: SRPBCC family protein [Rhodoferax sp.]